MLHTTRSPRVGAAYTGSSGAPYARLRSGVGACDPEGQCFWEIPPRIEVPGAHRTPAYSSLDLLVDWNHSFRTWQFGAYLQVRNALNHKNRALYAGYYEYRCGPAIRNCQEGYDQFAPSPPRLPLIGFRIAF